METRTAREPRLRNIPDNEYIAKYVSYLNESIQGISAKGGKLVIPRNDEMEEIPCVSIDSVVGLPEDYSAKIVPKKPNGGYTLDLIMYTPGKGEDIFTEIFGQGAKRAKVEFGNRIRLAIYDILMGEGGIEDLTIMPWSLKLDRWGHLDKESLENKEIVENRYLNNRNRLWLYYTSHFDGKNGSPAFVVHTPLGPYQAVPLIKKWFEEMQRLGRGYFNNQTPHS